MKAPVVTLKVSEAKPGELIYPAIYTASPKVLRVVTEAISEEITEADPVSIDIVLAVHVFTKKQVAGQQFHPLVEEDE